MRQTLEQAPGEWPLALLQFERMLQDRLVTPHFQPIVTLPDKRTIGYESLGRDAMLSAPTPDHYLPLLYILAQRQGDEPVTFPVQGFDGGSISMLAVQIG